MRVLEGGAMLIAGERMFLVSLLMHPQEKALDLRRKSSQFEKPWCEEVGGPCRELGGNPNPGRFQISPMFTSEGCTFLNLARKHTWRELSTGESTDIPVDLYVPDIRTIVW